MGKKTRKTKKPQKRRVLADHQQRGKKFIPPLKAKLGDKLGTFEWVDDLMPGILWIALTVDQRPMQRAVDLLLKCVQETHRVSSNKDPFYLYIFEYERINADEAKTIREALEKEGVLDDLQIALIPLVSLYPECPLKILFDEEARKRHVIDSERALDILKRVVKDCLDRTSRIATISQALVVYIQGMTGRLKMNKKLAEEHGLNDLNLIFEYPNSDRSKHLATAIRAMINMFPTAFYIRKDWGMYFWRRGYEISDCEFPIMDKESSDKPDAIDFSEAFEKSIYPYPQELFREIYGFWNSIDLDLAKPERDEVLGGLVARQARFVSELVTNPRLWFMDLGRIILRCMAETYISFKWLVKCGNEKDFDGFVNYGLGQEKLLTEHLLTHTVDNDSLKGRIEELRKTRPILDVQDVNVGFWKSPRTMAEEADCLDRYNLVFSSFSNFIHGSWDVLSRHNLGVCVNPLHRYHRVPSPYAPPMYLGIVTHALEIMNDTFRIWEEAYGKDPLKGTSSERLKGTLENEFPEAIMVF